MRTFVKHSAFNLSRSRAVWIIDHVTSGEGYADCAGCDDVASGASAGEVSGEPLEVLQASPAPPGCEGECAGDSLDREGHCLGEFMPTVISVACNDLHTMNLFSLSVVFFNVFVCAYACVRDFVTGLEY